MEFVSTPPRLSARVAWKHALEGGDQQGELLCDDPPDSVVVDRVVTVRDPVAGGDRVPPGTVRIPHLPFPGDAVGCLAHDLDELSERQLEDSILVQVAPGPLPSDLYPFPRVVQHVTHWHRIIAPGHTIPRLPPALRRGSTCSASSGCSGPRVAPEFLPALPPSRRTRIPVSFPARTRPGSPRRSSPSNS